MLVRDPVTDSIIEHSRNESSKSPASTDSDCLIVESVFQTQLAKDVVDTLRQLRSPCVTERHIESVDPKNVLMFLSKIDSEFTMGEQQDAQECLTLLLNELFAKLPETALSFIGYLSVYQTCLDCAVQKDKIVDRYSTLILPLPNTSECRLEECMDQYFEDEILDDENKVQCETCSRNTATGKTTKLLTTPESLYLILGRSKLNQKNCAVVSLPRYINMANRVVEVLPEHEHRHEYSLEAVVLHRGPTTNSDHYTVLIRQGSKWLHFDDDNNVRTKKEEYFETKGVQTDVYILRYKKKEYEEYLYLEETDANFSCVEDKKFWSPSTKGDEESRRPSTHPVIENTVDVCDESDLETLKNGQWLNERVVNAYLKLIEREAKKANNSRIKIIESYILQKWHSNRNAVIAEIWTRQHKRFLLFDEDIVLFPVNETNHWTLMRNCDDCGVFLCKYAEYIALERKIDFDQKDMPYFRRMINKALQDGHL